MSADKFKALVHFVIHECKDPARLGATRLNKILWYVDSIAYRATGDSVSNAAYVKRQLGPVPERILATLRQLESDGVVTISEPSFAYQPREFFAVRPPDLKFFNEFEQQLVRDLVDEICTNFTANEISELSHDEVWNAAAEGEEIPMSATLVAQGGEFGERVSQWAGAQLDRIAGPEAGA